MENKHDKLIAEAEKLSYSNMKTTYEPAIAMYQSENLRKLDNADLTFGEYHKIFAVKYYKNKKKLLKNNTIFK